MTVTVMIMMHDIPRKKGDGNGVTSIGSKFRTWWWRKNRRRQGQGIRTRNILLVAHYQTEHQKIEDNDSDRDAAAAITRRKNHKEWRWWRCRCRCGWLCDLCRGIFVTVMWSSSCTVLLPCDYSFHVGFISTGGDRGSRSYHECTVLLWSIELIISK